MGKVYTRKGDGGTSSTIRGKMGKSDKLADALGTIDELNSWLGLIRSEIMYDVRLGEIEKYLERVQRNLLVSGSGIAGSGLRVAAGEVKSMEKLIDYLTKDLSELKNFIYPFGVGKTGYFHLARTVCRRSERAVVAVVKEIEDGGGNVGGAVIYLNRLSDLLFTMARWVNWKLGGEEKIWK